MLNIISIVFLCANGIGMLHAVHFHPKDDRHAISRSKNLKLTSTKKSWAIPFGGNAYTINYGGDAKELITQEGIENWVSPRQAFELYFHTSQPGKFSARLRLRVPNGSSRLSVNIADKNFTNFIRNVKVTGSEFYLKSCGVFDVSIPGYVRVIVKGLHRTGEKFADISHLILVFEEAVQIEPKVEYVKEQKDFYFGRRGPSVHINYIIPEYTKYFYSEVTVPNGRDPLGAFYVACNFAEGYLGIQVNSKRERRILFSVWNESEFDNAGDVPEDYKVKLIHKSGSVELNRFGSEGTGVQAIMRYNWSTGITYSFLVESSPEGNETNIAAWINLGGTWQFIARFLKPKVSRYITYALSFVENFNPSYGNVERLGLFGNQWACDKEGKWTEIFWGRFSEDNNGKEEKRLDYYGGVGVNDDKTQFFLKHCGFFNDYIKFGTWFRRESSGRGIPVEVSKMPETDN